MAFIFCQSMAKTTLPDSSQPKSPMRGKCESSSTANSHRDRKELYNQFRMGELLSSPLSQERAFATRLIVNFFDGGPNTFVEYRIGKREPSKMDRVVRSDPFVEEEFARNEATKKPWVKALPHRISGRRDCRATFHRVPIALKCV